MARKLTLKDQQTIAAQKGGRCLSSTYINNHSYLEWECANGHRWTAASKTIRKGSWCPHCYNSESRSHAKRDPNKLAEVKAKAKEMGGRCVSTDYINNRSPLQFVCGVGHTWSTTWKILNKGSWCPSCAILNSKIHINGRINLVPRVQILYF